MEVRAARVTSRVRTVRRRRGLSQEAVAGLAGISGPYVSQLETGKRQFERRGLLEDLATAMGCSVADLTGQPYLPTDRDTADARSSLPAIRLALNDYRAEDVPDISVRPLDQLLEWADRADGYRDQTQFALAGRNISELMLGLQALTGSTEVRTRAFPALVNITALCGAIA